MASLNHNELKHGFHPTCFFFFSAASIAELEVSATKGSAEHQRHLGLHHLKQYELGQDVDKNAELAVKWLVKASRTGDEQATLALRECLQKDIGMRVGGRDSLTRWPQGDKNMVVTLEMYSPNYMVWIKSLD